MKNDHPRKSSAISGIRTVLHKNFLFFSVFVTGACVLVIEIAAVRALSPYFGNTLFTVSSVISIILAALSIGYYAGGRMADREPHARRFFHIILLGGITTITAHTAGVIMLPLFGLLLSPITGPLFSALVLFFLPALVLGMLSPYAIKLASEHSPNEGVGAISGAIFFWSTLGSIAGSLAAGFFLIPNFGIDRIFLGTGAMLLMLGGIPLLILGDKRVHLIQAVLFAIGLSAFAMYGTYTLWRDTRYHKDGVYELITIRDREWSGRPARFLEQDRTSSGAMFLDTADPTDLVYDYTKYYALHELVPQATRILVIGGGAYSIPKAFLRDLPNAVVDVVDIEPEIFALAREHFALSLDPRLANQVADGRRFLRETAESYDIIFGDAYQSLYSVPAHMMTSEFFALAKERLRPDGIFIANVIGDLSTEHDSLILAELKTFRAVFPESHFFAVRSPDDPGAQNVIFVGYKGAAPDLDDEKIRGSQYEVVRSLRDHVIDIARFDLTDHPLLTDNFAPVEYLSAKVLERVFSSS